MNNDILVVENTEGISEILNISLASEFNAITAENGAKALKLLREKYFSILICDVKIPDMDGIEFLCKVKKQNPYTEVIMIAGKSEADLGVTSLKYDASDFIIKPVTSSSLEIVIDRARKKIAINQKLNLPSPDDILQGKTFCLTQFIDIFSDVSKDAVAVLLDKQCRIVHESSKFKKLFGDLAGTNFSDLNKGCGERHYKVLSTSTKVVDDAVLNDIKGNEINCEITSWPVKNNDKMVDFILETLTLKN